MIYDIFCFVTVADFPSFFAHGARFFLQRGGITMSAVWTTFSRAACFLSSQPHWNHAPRWVLMWKDIILVEPMEPHSRPHDWAVFRVIMVKRACGLRPLSDIICRLWVCVNPTMQTPTAKTPRKFQPSRPQCTYASGTFLVQVFATIQSKIHTFF